MAICNECARDNSRLLPPSPRESRALQGPGNGVPVLHVAPICTRLRQIRVVLQELEQDDVEVVAPRPGSKHVDTGRKTTQRAVNKKNEICNSNKLPRENFISIAVFINLKKKQTITTIADFNFFEQNKICTMHFCNHFGRDNFWTEPLGQA